MTYGLLDLPSPLYEALDGALAAVLPAWLRILMWALVASAASMALYWLLSPQAKIAQAKAAAVDARRRLREHEGDFAEAGPLIRAQLGASFRQIGLVLPATLIASLPVLTLLVWMDTTYGRTLPPPAEAPRVEVVPAEYQAQWRQQGSGPPVVVVSGTNGEPVIEIPILRPVPIVERQQWWNWLIANPLGYLPEGGQLDRITFELPSPDYLSFGPGWVRSWLTLFLPMLVLSSLAIIRFGRIH